MKCTIYDPSQDMPVDGGGNGFGPLQDEIDYEEDGFYEEEPIEPDGIEIEEPLPEAGTE